ncbi:uncharacterized protein LOC120410065 isoform X2 [Corvus cornix cornix]|uniref:uncharacterized protein LOC120410065 isoform X2 n=1 Tax=Corvus cornix cornix TaxID=932674 RepID=UPI001950D02A|nr:uncharacterized protein LOC120410065 isoform X2 [Corvus cornix cornix]
MSEQPGRRGGLPCDPIAEGSGDRLPPARTTTPRGSPVPPRPFPWRPGWPQRPARMRSGPEAGGGCPPTEKGRGKRGSIGEGQSPSSGQKKRGSSPQREPSCHSVARQCGARAKLRAAKGADIPGPARRPRGCRGWRRAAGPAPRQAVPCSGARVRSGARSLRSITNPSIPSFPQCSQKNMENHLFWHRSRGAPGDASM